MKRIWETPEFNSENKRLKMNDSMSFQTENCENLTFTNKRNNVDQTSLQKTNVSRKLVIKNFGLFILPIFKNLLYLLLIFTNIKKLINTLYCYQ